MRPDHTLPPLPVDTGYSPPPPLPAERPRRARWLAWTCLVTAVLAAAMVGVGVFATMNTVDLASPSPFGTALAWLTFTAVASAIAVVAFLGAIIATVVSRPRGVAWVALAASIVLPASASLVSGYVGVAVFQSNTAAALRADGALTERALDVMESWNVDVGPLRHTTSP